METQTQHEARLAQLETARAARRGETRSLVPENVPEVFFPRSDAGPVVTQRGALAIGDVYACVRCLADSAASLPLHVYRRGADGGRERVEGGPASVLERPAPGVPQAVLVAQLVAHLQLWGEAFLGLYRGEAGDVQQVGLLPPDTVAVEVIGGLPVYTVTALDRVMVLGPDDVVHVRGLTLDALRGLSPVAQARQALGLAQSLTDQASATARNGARLGGVLTVSGGGPDQDDVMDNLRDAFGARHAGTQQAGKVAVLSGDVSFQPVSMSLADAEFIAQRELSTREVCRIFRVPPWMIGGSVADSLTYSTVAEQSRAFVVHSLGPWLAYIEQAINASPLVPEGSGLYVQFVLDGLLRGDPAARAAVYTAALNPQTGWLSRDEVRRLEDLPTEQRQEAPTT